MALGAPIFGGSVSSPGLLIPQEGTSFRTTEWGYDEGERRWLTHPNTNLSQYPQRNQADAQYPKMYVRDVIPRTHESGLILITALYKGLISIAGPMNKVRVLPGADTQAMSIGVLSSGKSVTLLAQIPKDVCTIEYLTTSQPNLSGVGGNASSPYLPGSTAFAVTFVPDPNAAPPPMNYKTGWVLDDRSWEDVASAVFLVRERYGYYQTVG